MNDTNPYYKAKAQNKRKPIKTNLKGPIRVWVPKSDIIFVEDMLKGKNKITTLFLRKWLLTTYNKRKACVPNPKS